MHDGRQNALRPGAPRSSRLLCASCKKQVNLICTRNERLKGHELLIVAAERMEAKRTCLLVHRHKCREETVQADQIPQFFVGKTSGTFGGTNLRRPALSNGATSHNKATRHPVVTLHLLLDSHRRHHLRDHPAKHPPHSHHVSRGTSHKNVEIWSGSQPHFRLRSRHDETSCATRLVVVSSVLHVVSTRRAQQTREGLLSF